MDLHVSSLPWELEEEILSRLPPESLVRFRAVSKRWNSLLNNKSFIKKHLSLSRPHFIFLTKSKICSIDIIDQTIDVRELHSSCSRGLNSVYGTITCDDLLFCYDRQRVAVDECASHALRFIETPNNNMHISENAKRSHVSLNGNLYWIRQTHEYFIQSFDFYLGDFPTRLS
ncbi:unnamed protein product [Brassica napus]|uniref:(rape) hypothetical protein n=1 Tax=Brassica napus TaxID=3708 RepID=A0A816Y4N3_BRANA|nr:unnamed protein product [Brassica napus]